MTPLELLRAVADRELCEFAWHGPDRYPGVIRVWLAVDGAEPAGSLLVAHVDEVRRALSAYLGADVPRPDAVALVLRTALHVR